MDIPDTDVGAFSSCNPPLYLLENIARRNGVDLYA
jgi:hypothetical protein